MNEIQKMIIKNGGSIFFTDSYWTKSLEDENEKNKSFLWQRIKNFINYWK